jgi:hypothetical protein
MSDNHSDEQTNEALDDRAIMNLEQQGMKRAVRECFDGEPRSDTKSTF